MRTDLQQEGKVLVDRQRQVSAQAGKQHWNTDLGNNERNLIWSVRLLRIKVREGRKDIFHKNFDRGHKWVRRGRWWRNSTGIVESVVKRKKFGHRGQLRQSKRRQKYHQDEWALGASYHAYVERNILCTAWPNLAYCFYPHNILYHKMQWKLWNIVSFRHSV